MDLQTVLMIAGATGFLGWIGRLLLKRLTALEAVAKAQLTANGGGSLVDRVNQTWAAVPELQISVTAIKEKQKSDHNEALARWSHIDDVNEFSSKEVAGLRDNVGRFRMELDERSAEMAVRLDTLASGQDVLATRLDEGAAFWNQLLEAFLSGVFGPDMERVGKYVQQRIAAAKADESEGK